MNRRGFFGALAAIAATAALDPERMLWVPGKKLISIPAPAAYPTVAQMLEEAIRRLGYIRPLRGGELADTFLEMTAMVDRFRLGPVAIFQPVRARVVVREYVECATAVRNASQISRYSPLGPCG